jgi:hypothetical protein
MQLSDILALVLSLLSIAVSVTVAYLTLMARFKGKIWPVTSIVLTKISTPDKDNIPVIGLACFLENQGARPGRLDKLRLKVSNTKVESSVSFYPHIMRKDYSIFASYQDSDWFPFGGVGLFEKGKVQEYYLIFKPRELDYVPYSGEYEIVLEALWMGSKRWAKVKPVIPLILTEKNISDWRSPTTPAFQIEVNVR